MTFFSLSNLLGFDDVTPIEGMTSPRRVAGALRAGVVPADVVFDQFLPHDLKLLSRQHWTPLSVGVFGARWLERLGVRRVVDIGSGAGKFCIAGALTTDICFVGIEQRARLVDVAESMARAFEIHDRAQFVHATVEHSEVPPADAYYLYNPFEENLFCEEDWIDARVEHTRDRFRQGVEAVERLATQLPGDSFLLVYNGFGGRVPAGYVELFNNDCPRRMRLWRKMKRADASSRLG